MRRLMWVLVVSVGCGGNDQKPGDAPPADVQTSQLDAPVVPPCDPIAQTGCGSGEECTWIIDQDGTGSAPDVGHVGCAPTGTIAAGANCAIPTAAAGGHDHCVPGTYCLDGTCQATCDPAVANCDADHACVEYDNVFETGTSTVAGICEVMCDPLTQAMKFGTNTAACGSTTASAPSRGCFTTDNITYACSPTVASRYTKTDGIAPVDANGVAANSCAPGYIPMLVQAQGSITVICSGLCAPLDTSASLPNNAKGDGTVLGKQPTDPAPVAGHAKCTVFAAGGKGSVAAEQCSYMWTLLYDSMNVPIESQYKDNLGYCFAYSAYDYDPAGGANYTTPMPGCAALSPRIATTSGTYDDAFDWGCSSTATDATPNATPMIRLERATGITKMRVRRRL